MMNKEDRKLKLPLLLAAIPFITGSVDSFSQDDVLFGSLNLAMAVINLIAVKYIKSLPTLTNTVLFLLNAALAALISYNYYLAGKTGLPYAWAFTSILYLAVAIYFPFKAKNDLKKNQ